MLENKDIKKYSYGFGKYWYWFTQPFDIPGVSMLNFFDYQKYDVPGFRRKEGLTTVIDLTESLDTIWNKMRHKFIRKQIERGERHGIIVKQDNNFAEFKKIYKNFREKKYLNKEKIDKLKNHTVLFSAYYQNKMIAGGIFVADNKHARALVLASAHNSSDSKIREIIGQANRLLIWEAIKYFKNKNLELFDLGGISPDSQNPSLRNLAEFKEAFGGFRKSCYYYHKVYSRLLKFWIKIRKY